MAFCAAGVVALLEHCILEAWSPGGLEPGDVQARMMRLRMKMLMNDDPDEDEKEFSHALAWGARQIW